MNEWKIDDSWTLFLDRDGVINERIMGGYVLALDEFHFLDGAIDAIVGLSGMFGRTVVVTNQQGIGKKLMTERNLEAIHAYMCETVAQHGGKIDRCYFAPNSKGTLPDYRKPGPHMALKAQQDFPEINFSKSIMVGDTDSDIMFGRNLGMKTVRIKTVEKIGIEADATVNSLWEFYNSIG